MLFWCTTYKYVQTICLSGAQHTYAWYRLKLSLEDGSVHGIEHILRAQQRLFCSKQRRLQGLCPLGGGALEGELMWGIFHPVTTREGLLLLIYRGREGERNQTSIEILIQDIFHKKRGQMNWESFNKENLNRCGYFPPFLIFCM